uniref:Golgi SNAP receptor complex member 1 n=1 Tax=Spongospora subterranea TaxID=70186 RepID=A0A0H5QW71_9EUKA|eukprot:CRZ06238.1 hypothetical protein [Spongospora subterranea]
MEGSGSDFDNYKTQARRLEKQIYGKLEELSALNIGAIRQAQSSLALRTVSQDLSNGAIALQNCIKSLFEKFSETISRMDEHLESLPSHSPQRKRMAQVVDRFREINRDYLLEFSRTQNALRSSIQRAELFAGDKSHRDGSNSESDMLLREKNNLNASIDMIDELIGRAEATRDGLGRQRGVFSSTADRLDQLARKFPLIHSSINRINRHRQRDKFALAFVLAVCMLFTLWYSFG